jgi:hypothetical protein
MVYGWFERAQRGVYQLTADGEEIAVTPIVTRLRQCPFKGLCRISRSSKQSMKARSAG